MASSLPNCPSKSPYLEKWDNCFGAYTWVDGDNYIGEYKVDKMHGQGTYTYASGLKESGYHMNDEFVPTICENMGLKKGTDSFGQCVLKLIDKVYEDD